MGEQKTIEMVQVDFKPRRAVYAGLAAAALIGAVVVGHSHYEARVRENHLLAAASCRGSSYEELRRSAEELALSTKVSLTNAARMYREVSCPDEDV